VTSVLSASRRSTLGACLAQSMRKSAARAARLTSAGHRNRYAAAPMRRRRIGMAVALTAGAFRRAGDEVLGRPAINRRRRSGRGPDHRLERWIASNRCVFFTAITTAATVARAPQIRIGSCKAASRERGDLRRGVAARERKCCLDLGRTAASPSTRAPICRRRPDECRRIALQSGFALSHGLARGLEHAELLSSRVDLPPNQKERP